MKTAYHQIGIRASDKPYTAFEANGYLWQFTRIPNGVTNGVAAFQHVIDAIIKKGLMENYAYLDNVTVCGNTEEELVENRKLWENVAKKYGITFNIKKTVPKCTEAVLGYLISHDCVKRDHERFNLMIYRHCGEL